MADAIDTIHTFELSILTPEKTAFQEQVYSIIVPGADGYFEILAHHAPIIALIHPGKLTLIDQNHKQHIYAVSNGILEVSNNQANLLIDSIEAAEEIDLVKAKQAYERAEGMIQSHESGLDLERAKKALERAKNRIKVYESTH